MRELIVYIRFDQPCLGCYRTPGWTDGRLSFPRTPDGAVMFLPTHHKENMRFAAELLGRHQHDVPKILWSVAIESVFLPDRWYKRYYQDHGRKKYATHEAFFPGQSVGISCVVPSTISDDDLKQLMNIAGKYKGLSPFMAGDYGHFQVESVKVKTPTETPKEIAMSMVK